MISVALQKRKTCAIKKCIFPRIVSFGVITKEISRSLACFFLNYEHISSDFA